MLTLFLLANALGLNQVPVESVRHLSCGDNLDPGEESVQVTRVCRSVLKKDVPEYQQANYLVFFYSDGLASGAVIQQAWNVAENEGLAPGDDWIVSVYFEGKLPIVRDLGYWYDLDTAKPWWMRGLSARVSWDEVQSKKLDPNLGVLEGDDPRGLRFKAEMKLSE